MRNTCVFSNGILPPLRLQPTPPEAGRAARVSEAGPAGRDGSREPGPSSRRSRHAAADRIRRPPPPQRPGSRCRKRIPGRTANTSNALPIRPVRPSYPPPLRSQPPEAGRAARVSEAGAAGRDAASRRQDPPEPARQPQRPGTVRPGHQQQPHEHAAAPGNPRRLTRGAFFKKGGRPAKPHRPPFSHARDFFSSLGEKKARTHYAHARARVDGGRICRAAGRDRLHLHRRHDTPCTAILSPAVEVAAAGGWPGRHRWPEPAGRDAASRRQDKKPLYTAGAARVSEAGAAGRDGSQRAAAAGSADLHRLNALDLAGERGFLDGWPTTSTAPRYALYGPFFSPRNKDFFFFQPGIERKAARVSEAGPARPHPPPKNGRAVKIGAGVCACARRTAPEPAGRMGAGSPPADTPRRRIRRG